MNAHWVNEDDWLDDPGFTINQIWQEQGFHIVNRHPNPGYRGRWFVIHPFRWGPHPKGCHLYRNGFLKQVIKEIVMEGPSDIAISRRLRCDRKFVHHVRESILPLLHRFGKGLPHCHCGRKYGHGGHCRGKFSSEYFRTKAKRRYCKDVLSPEHHVQLRHASLP